MSRAIVPPVADAPASPLSLPWLLVAVPRELSAFCRLDIATLRRRPTSVWHCILDDREFILGETGVGGAMVGQTLDWLARSNPPRFVVLAGFAGALDENLRVGDGILANGVVDPTGVFHAATLPLNLPYPRWPVAHERSSHRHAGRESFAWRKSTARSRSIWKRRTSPRWCERRGVPWGCVRAISDDVRTPVSRKTCSIFSKMAACRRGD